MKRKTIYSVLIIIALIPIVLNYLLRIPPPFDVPIVSDAGAWLQFWGSYLGGILTASIGFYTLHVSEKKNLEKEIEAYKEERAKMLQNELISRLTPLSYYKIQRVLHRLQNKITKEEAIREKLELEERLEQSNQAYLSWAMMAWHDMPTKPKAFDEEFGMIIHVFQNDIQSVITLLENYCSSDILDSEEIKRQVDAINTRSVALFSFVKEAKDWIMQETGN